MCIRLCVNFPALPPRMWLALLLIPPVYGQKPEIPYVPGVVFRGTPLTLQVTRMEQEDVLIFINEREVSRLKPGKPETGEVTFFPREPLNITVRTEKEPGWTFQVVRPADLHAFTERDGFLYVGDTPVILMPDHNIPPELDRRWETFDRVSGALQSVKPEITSIQAFLPKTSTLLEDLPSLWNGDQVRRRAPSDEAWFHLHGFLTGFRAAPADFVLFEVDFHDLERGMSPVAWLMKWQYLLQHIQAGTGYKDGLLAGPVPGPDTGNWMKFLEPSLISLARSHGLHYVDRSLSAEVWRERLVHRLQKRYVLP